MRPVKWKDKPATKCHLHEIAAFARKETGKACPEASLNSLERERELETEAARAEAAVMEAAVANLETMEIESQSATTTKPRTTH